MNTKQAIVLPVAASLLALSVLALATNVQAQTSIHLWGEQPSTWSQSPSLTDPNPTITINVSTDYIFFLHSADGIGHTFLIDLNGNGAHDAGEPFENTFNLSTPPVQLPVNIATPGTYSYLCTIHPGMKGSLVVQGGSGNTNLLLILSIVIVVIVVGAAAAVVWMRRRGPKESQPPQKPK